VRATLAVGPARGGSTQEVRMPSDPKIKDDLERFAKLDPGLLKDGVCISDELSAGPESIAVRKGLQILEERLSERAKNDPKHQMGSVLLASERQWGVNVDSNNSVRVTALGFLSAQAFAGELQSATLIKDPGAGTDHGEYTHRVQWFIVHEMKLAAKDNALLRCMGAPEMLPDKGNLNGLWDCIFDRLRRPQRGLKAYIATGKDDFRSPEHFNTWLRGCKDYPVLSLYLEKRFDKRQPDKVAPELMLLVEWLRGHQDSKAWSVFEQAKERDNAAEALIGIVYALRKAGKSLKALEEKDVDAAALQYQSLLLRR
jgi:hypothetical protein